MSSPADSPAEDVQSRQSRPSFWQITAVVVILMIVGAVIMPFPRDRASEPRNIATCSDHMRVLGSALLQYSGDYDSNFPVGLNGAGYGWAGAIEPYVKSMVAKSAKPEAAEDEQQAIWACPDDPTGPDRSVDPPGLAISYSLNATLTGDKHLPNCATNLSRLTSPPKTVMLFETRGAIVQVDRPQEGGGSIPATGWFSGVGNGMANRLQHGGLPANLDAIGPIRYDTGDMGARGCRFPACYAPRHATYTAAGRGANFLCADGHVKFELAESVSSGNTPSAPGRQTGGLAAGTAASAQATDAQISGQADGLTFSAR